MEILFSINNYLLRSLSNKDATVFLMQKNVLFYKFIKTLYQKLLNKVISYEHLIVLIIKCTASNEIRLRYLKR